MYFSKYSLITLCTLLFFFNITNNFAQTGCYQIDWETDCLGNAFDEGFYVTADAYDCIGVTITNNSALPLVLFNSSVPTGDDADLGTPSANCPTCSGFCPGESNNPNGGLTNCVDQGLVMITEENPEDDDNDGLEDEPDDLNESDYEFTFDAPVTISTLGFIDDSNGEIVFTYSDNSTSTVSLIGGLDNDIFSQVFNESDVIGMQVILTTSGAISLIDFCYDEAGQAPCDLVAPVLGTDIDLCEGTNPAIIEVLTPASGTGTIMYQWQQSLVGCVGFGDILGATSSTYNPGVLVQSTYFKVVVTTMNGNQVCVEESNCISYVEEENCPDFDLALKKTIAVAGPYEPEDDVDFEIKVYNQGQLDATNVEVKDYLPIGLKLNDSNWDTLGNQQVAVNTIPFLAAGDSATLMIRLRINSGFQSATGELINNAEITSAAGGTDIDSPFSFLNDGTTNELATDNDVDDDGANTPGTADNLADEDDYDAALINVNCPVPVCLPATIEQE